MVELADTPGRGPGILNRICGIVPRSSPQSLKESTMQAINLNAMANRVALGEGGRTEVNIAQIKEVMKIFLEELARYNDEEILEVVKRHKKD